jgi:hypothetical protein
LRRLEKDGLDFTKPYRVDFNVDFNHWPPSPEALSVLRSRFPNARFVEASSNSRGYMQFQIFEMLSYNLLVRLQAEISESMAPFGGVCESWGLLI